MNDFKKGNFIHDEEKMEDFYNLTKKEFLASYSYLSEEEYDNTKAIDTAWLEYVKYRSKIIELIVDGRELLNRILQKSPIIVDTILEEFDENLNHERSFLTPTFIKKIESDGYFVGSVALEDNIFYGEDFDYQLNQLTIESLLRILDRYKIAY